MSSPRDPGILLLQQQIDGPKLLPNDPADQIREWLGGGESARGDWRDRCWSRRLTLIPHELLLHVRIESPYCPNLASRSDLVNMAGPQSRQNHIVSVTTYRSRCGTEVPNLHKEPNTAPVGRLRFRLTRDEMARRAEAGGQDTGSGSG